MIKGNKLKIVSLCFNKPNQNKMKLLITFIIIVFSYSYSQACTVIVVGKKVSKDGSIILSQTDNGDDSRIRVVPAMNYPAGSMANVYWGIQEVNRSLDDWGEVIGQIPQVESTYKYFHSAYPHMNEHQLVMAESTTSMREEMMFKVTEGDQIMTIEQAQIFALQRCKTAREAVKLIGSLMEEYGFLPSCVGESESVCIGGKEEVWVFEVKAVGAWKKDSGKPGAIWAAQRVPDDHVLIIPNWSIIKEIDEKDKDNFMFSKNYKQFAVDKGWYNPKSGKPFSWQEAYSPILREWASGRFWLFYSDVAPNLKDWPDRKLTNPYKGLDQYHQFVEDVDLYPFSVKPEKKLGVEDIMAYQRSTFEGTIYDMTSDPDWYVPTADGKLEKSPLTTPFPTKAMRELLDINHRRNVSRGVYGMIAQIRDWLPDEIGGLYWVYLDNQYTSTYIPIHVGVSELNPRIKTYNPDEFDPNSLRWSIDFVDNLLYLRWQDAVRDLKLARDPLEQEIMNDLKNIENKALELYKEDHEKLIQYLSKNNYDLIEKIDKFYKSLQSLLITRYTNNKQGS